MRSSCEACGKTFKSITGFDKHRIGDYAKPGERNGTRRCMTTEQMMKRGMQQNERGMWITAPRPEQLVMKEAS